MDKLLPESLGLIGKVGLGALLLVLVLAPGIGGYPTGAMYGSDVALCALRALVCVAALCLTFDSGTPDAPATPLPRLTRIAAATLAGLTVLSLLVHSSFLTSPVLLFAMLPVTLDWLCYALVLVLCARLARDRAAFGLLIAALVLGSAWASLSGIREYGQHVQEHQKGQRISGTFFDPNFIAGFLALSLPILAAWALAVRERLGTLSLGALTVLTCGALAATGSRAGIAIAAGGLVVAFLLVLISGAARRLPWARIGVMLAAAVTLAFFCKGPLTARLNSSGAGGGAIQEQSGAFRAWTWKGTIAMAKANPVLGTGPGTFPYRYPPYALVAKTELAHSSYLQLAAEQGFPALLTALLTLAAAGLSGVTALLRARRSPLPTVGAPEDTDNFAGRLLLCGLIGALVAGAARSLFDSEWSILGNALPLWAVAGMVTSPHPTTHYAGTRLPRHPQAGTRRGEFLAGAAATSAPPLPPRGRGWGWGLSAILGLIFSLLLLRNAQSVDAAQAQIQQHQPVAAAGGWPPDPNLLYWSGQPGEAARIEPSSRRFYQWARFQEHQGDFAGAVPLFQKSTDADPNNLQAWRALAETQEKAGNAAGALEAWRELIKRFEGPAGQIRAIPELPETYPAFAYVAVAREAAQKGNKTEAAADYEKAAGVIEAYSHTPPLYQQMELATAALNNVDVLARRAEVRGLYEEIIHAWSDLVSAGEKSALQQRETETLARMDAFAKPETGIGTAPNTP